MRFPPAHLRESDFTDYTKNIADSQNIRAIPTRLRPFQKFSSKKNRKHLQNQRFCAIID